MACGTGKTFTSLQILESLEVNKNPVKRVLFLVPSFNLIKQVSRDTLNLETQIKDNIT